jgi:hypothetical protein
LGTERNNKAGEEKQMEKTFGQAMVNILPLVISNSIEMNKNQWENNIFKALTIRKGIYFLHPQYLP